jgi:ACT domain-containing protein
MARPRVADDRRDRLAQLVDEEADVPASILTVDQQLDYLLDAFVSYRDHAEALDGEVTRLERELEEAQSDGTIATTGDGFRSR